MSQKEFQYLSIFYISRLSQQRKKQNKTKPTIAE